MFGFLVVALLERGAPMTLEEVAVRLQAAGVAPGREALRALKRCRPARPPVYRDGDEYGLDPRSDELDMLAFQFGLRPPRMKAPPPAPSVPRRASDQSLTIAELDEAWREANLLSWSQQRIALAVLDAHGHAMNPEDAVAFVRARTQWCPLKVSTGSFVRRGSAVRVREDGCWESVAGQADLVAVREAVRDRVDTTRRYARPDQAALEASRRIAEQRREQHAAELSGLRRAIVHAFPARRPVAAVMVDLAAHEVWTFVGDELATLRDRLVAHDVLAGIDIRAVLRALRLDAGERRLADLAPPQKAMTLNRRGRTLRITTAMLVQGSCGISRPFGTSDALESYLAGGQTTKFRRRLEADAKSLFALYQYGRTHGAVRLRWGFLDEMLPAPWVHRDEIVLYDLKRKAHTLGIEIEAVVGSAPGWDEPWARARRCRATAGQSEYDLVLFDEEGLPVDDRDVQLARLATTIH
jgi:hypothetical protein